MTVPPIRQPILNLRFQYCLRPWPASNIEKKENFLKRRPFIFDGLPTWPFRITLLKRLPSKNEISRERVLFMSDLKDLKSSNFSVQKTLSPFLKIISK